MMHKSTTTSWVKPPSTFTPAPELGRPPGGSSPVIHFFREQETGARWIGKVGQVPLRNKEVLETARRLPGFLGVYADEILEKLGLAVYQLLGTEVPESVLSYQQVTMEAMHPDMLLAMQLNAEDEGRVFELPHSPRMHHLSRYVEDFQPLDANFVEKYISKSKTCGKEYVKIQTRDGELLPLRGLGSMLAAADFIYDLDCLGDNCGNAGYVIKLDPTTGERYGRLVKIDAGYAFSYSELRTDQSHNPKDRQIRVAPNQMRLQFADLSQADQEEFATTAKRILSIPYEQFAHLFSQTEEIQEGLSIEHWLDLLNGLIARKNLFLKAFAHETDRSIINEIEAAQAQVAIKLEHTEEARPRAVEELLAQKMEEAVALVELRVKLAVVDVKESDPKKAGKCKTFQVPATKMHFIGREEALAQVVSQLSQSNGTVIGQSISGIGGVGKTQLALHYAQAAVNGETLAGQHLVYEYVVWFNAETFLEGQFQAIAEVWTEKHFKADEAVEAVYRFLKGKRTLFVFDNADNARSIATFLPPPNYGSPIHFIITSRSAQWGGLPIVKLGGFSLEEAQEYLAHHLGPQPKEVATKLLELLDGLPLAMSQAVSYIKSGHSTLEGFEEQFYLNQANLLSHKLIEDEAHPKTVGTTLTLSLAQAKVQSPIVEKLLGIMAYLASDNVRIELLVKALVLEPFLELDEQFTVDNIPKELLASRTKSVLQDIKHAINVLENYSLVSCEQKSLQVHRLVQEVLRHQHKFLKKPQSYLEKALMLLQNVIIFDETNLQAMKFCEHAIAHVQQLGKLSEKHLLNQKQSYVLAKLLQKSGSHQLTMGNYRAAKEFQKQELNIVQSHYSDSYSMLAISLNNLGNTYLALGKYNKAKDAFIRSISNMEQQYGHEHPEVAVMLGNLGAACGSLGENDKEKELLERSLAIKEKSYGHGSIETAITLARLGILYCELGDATKGKKFLKRALRIQEHHYGPDHPQTVQTLVNLANTYGDLNNFIRKKDLLERALPTLEEFYGHNHPKVAITLTNLANVYGSLEDMDKKRKLLERALTILEHHYGPDNPEVISTLTNLANAYGNIGNHHKEQNLLERVLAIQEQHYGTDHPQIANTLLSLSESCGNLGDNERQSELLKRCFVILECYYKSDHPQVALTIARLGHAYGRMGKVELKVDLLQRSLLILERHYGVSHPQLTAILSDLGDAYGNLGNINQKKELLERNLLIMENHYGHNHPQVAIALFNLARIYEELGDTGKQKDLLEQCLIVEKRCYGHEDPRVAITLFNLCCVYLVNGETLKAKKYVEKACLLFTKYLGAEHPITQDLQKARRFVQTCAEGNQIVESEEQNMIEEVKLFRIRNNFDCLIS